MGWLPGGSVVDGFVDLRARVIAAEAAQAQRDPFAAAEWTRHFQAAPGPATGEVAQGPSHGVAIEQARVTGTIQKLPARLDATARPR
jgi:hypothetical protein